ncbi:MAG: COX15/CtaA family protein [Saprospiraceae bacterium]|nr:COX15/CtaA family protein [Saprospiraceae bacterium]
MRNVVIVWIGLGLMLIFLQIIIGGVTRLTGSGLSITKWEIVTGIIPPLDQEDWQRAFDQYRETPQYQKINRQFILSDFKFIYFWEYLHRLWARAMGIVFLIPFLFFLWKKWIPDQIVKRLWVVFLLAGLVGAFGWIMVASGLVDRPWVSAYKLSIHLSLALLVMGYLQWTLLLSRYPTEHRNIVRDRDTWLILILVCIQIFLGALMSGMKAALIYPTFPDFHGWIIPESLLQKSNWTVDNLVNYDQRSFAPAIVQFLHRLGAYVLIIMVLWTIRSKKRIWKNRGLHQSPTVLIILLVIQVSLGIMVLINSVGTIPIGTGILHQAVGIMVLCTAINMHYFNYASDAEGRGDRF